ncbi:hypothetical protein J3R82DRAFT_1498, partial [Butyriboletus roseoflavus]
HGARGTVVDIILNQAEPPPSRTHRVVDLLHPPAFVLVKLQHSLAPRFGVEPETIIPIRPIKKTIRLNLHENSKKII